MEKRNTHLEAGFIALMSVLLISFMLITFAVSVGISGFLGRYNQLDSEIKEQSIASAGACVEKAIADLVGDNPTTGTVTFGGGLYSCTIVAILADTPSAGETTIKSQGVYKNSYTNLVVVVDSTTQATLSWREYATMP
jgi:CRISPR/Cas system CSM-associated protein Csm5 (group 7 of RAMP superfamily)